MIRVRFYLPKEQAKRAWMRLFEHVDTWAWFRATFGLDDVPTILDSIRGAPQPVAEQPPVADLFRG